MKRKLKRSWSAILPIIKKRTITFHLNSLNTKRGTTTYDAENSDPGVGQTQTFSGVKLVNVMSTMPYKQCKML